MFLHRFTQCLFLLLWMSPQSIYACAVCISNEGKVMTAFYIATALLSLLPFTMGFGFYWWFRKQKKQQHSSPEN